MTRSRRTLKPKLATEAWLKRGLLDFYLAFVNSELLNFRAFCLEQGIEKFCKAFLIATQGPQYEQLDSNAASQWIEDFVRSLGHDLRRLLGLVSIGIERVRPYLEDSKFLDILNRAYEEGRYPIPISKSIWSKHGFPALANSDLDDRSLELATVLWDGISEYFQRRGSAIAIPLQHRIYDDVNEDDWKRFMNIWKMREKAALSKYIELINSEPVKV